MLLHFLQNNEFGNSGRVSIVKITTFLMKLLARCYRTVMKAKCYYTQNDMNKK